MPPPWAPPSPVGSVAPAGGPARGPGQAFVGGVPLGGVRPVEQEAPEASNRRELILTAILLVCAVLTGAASLMSWRDEGLFVSSTVRETGWVLPDGSMGRGWVAVLLGVVLASAGVLLASDHLRSGRAVAMAGGVGLIVFSVLEWGLGAGRARTGPGLGIWVLFAVGVVVVIAVGILGSPPPEHDGA